jgi:O-antigen/teichoic acid export membrane protein
MTEAAPATPIAERFLRHNAIVGGSTLLAGVLGFAFQALISHRLQPSQYAAVFGAMTLLTLITLPTAALTLLMARETSRDSATGHYAASTALLREGNRLLIACGLALALILAAGSPWVAGFLNVPAGFVLAIAAGLPVALALPLLIGEIQGQQRFVSFSSLTAGQAGLKLVAAIVLGIVLGPIGVVGGLAVASTLIYLMAWLVLRRKLRSRVAVRWFRPAVRYLSLVLPSTLALSVLLSADVLLVNHFFAKSVAGEYGAVAALGRAIFWGATGVATVLFPKVIFSEVQGRSGTRIVALSLAVVILGGSAGLLLLSASSKLVLTAFSGAAYQGGASYLAGYAVAMTLLGCASVLIATHQSRARRAFLGVLIPVAVGEPLAIAAFHQDIIQVVQILNLTMAALVIGLAAVLLLTRRQTVTSRLAAGTRTIPAELRA